MTGRPLNSRRGGRRDAPSALAAELIIKVRACTLCEAALPFPPKPVLQAAAGARILIAGQAPGTKAHASGVPFDDPSGDRLREWMGIDRTTFYNPELIAILPMGFCYPGRGTSGDLPPLPICAATWRKPILEPLDSVRLTLVIGQHAQRWHLPHRKSNLTQTVAHWRAFGDRIPLPHPSPRNNIWLKKNSWFESDLLPDLQRKVARALTPQSGR